MRPPLDAVTGMEATVGDELIDVVITLTPAAQLEPGRVLAELNAAGLTVMDVLRPAGVVTGSITSNRIGRLLLVDGVSHVSRGETVQLRPPDSDIQ